MCVFGLAAAGSVFCPGAGVEGYAMCGGEVSVARFGQVDGHIEETVLMMAWTE